MLLCSGSRSLPGPEYSKTVPHPGPTTETRLLALLNITNTGASQPQLPALGHSLAHFLVTNGLAVQSLVHSASASLHHLQTSVPAAARGKSCRNTAPAVHSDIVVYRCPTWCPIGNPAPSANASSQRHCPDTIAMVSFSCEVILPPRPSMFSRTRRRRGAVAVVRVPPPPDSTHN